MDDWLSYSLIDFVPFSRETYLRLFERHNLRFWPAPLITLTLGAWMLWLLRRSGGRGLRLALGLLALAWSWVAWAFLIQSYGPLNWAAGYGAMAFVLQSLILLGVTLTPDWGGLSPRRGAVSHIGYALVVIAVVGLPVLELLLGRPWNGLEWIGMTPDPTILATLGVILMVRHRLRPLLIPIPTLWALISSLTLFALDDPLWQPLPAAALMVIALVLWQWARTDPR